MLCLYNLHVRMLILICPWSCLTLQDSNLVTETAVHHRASLGPRTSGPGSNLPGRSETPGSARHSFSRVNRSWRPFKASSVRFSSGFFAIRKKLGQSKFLKIQGSHFITAVELFPLPKKTHPSKIVSSAEYFCREVPRFRGNENWRKNILKICWFLVPDNRIKFQV